MAHTMMNGDILRVRLDPGGGFGGIEDPDGAEGRNPAAELTAWLQREISTAGAAPLGARGGLWLEAPGVGLASPSGKHLPNLEALLSAAQGCGTPIRVLDLSGNGLSDACAAQLASFIAQQATPLAELNLRDNAITARGLAALCAAFARHPHNAYVGGGPSASSTASSFGGMAGQTTAGTPCWLDLRGNLVAQPKVVLSWLSDFGVLTCCAARCSRTRCMHRAPVHLAFGLAKQRDGVLTSKEDMRMEVQRAAGYAVPRQPRPAMPAAAAAQPATTASVTSAPVSAPSGLITSSAAVTPCGMPSAAATGAAPPGLRPSSAAAGAAPPGLVPSSAAAGAAPPGLVPSSAAAGATPPRLVPSSAAAAAAAPRLLSSSAASLAAAATNHPPGPMGMVPRAPGVPTHMPEDASQASDGEHTWYRYTGRHTPNDAASVGGTSTATSVPAPSTLAGMQAPPPTAPTECPLVSVPELVQSLHFTAGQLVKVLPENITADQARRIPAQHDVLAASPLLVMGLQRIHVMGPDGEKKWVHVDRILAT